LGFAPKTKFDDKGEIDHLTHQAGSSSLTSMEENQLLQKHLLYSMKTINTAILLFTSALTISAAPLELASPFSEHMVLQREMPIPVWGWGTPGASVKVNIKGISGDAKVNKDGSWSLTLKPLPTGGPYTFDVTSGSEKIHWTDGRS